MEQRRFYRQLYLIHDRDDMEWGRNELMIHINRRLPTRLTAPLPREFGMVFEGLNFLRAKLPLPYFATKLFTQQCDDSTRRLSTLGFFLPTLNVSSLGLV